uniref:Uncharacterized protein n=1 Tax=Rhizophagus irregularis (strain DAOM 181602 / DAOM 197198 / MUCL 43194) TaxID=747089 RepID=U9SSF6_RHIID
MFNNEVFEQFQLFLKPKKSENKGMIKIFRFDLSHLNSEKKDSESVSLSGITYPFNGVVGFLPSKNSTILVCMNYIRMQKFRINNKNKVSFEMIEKDSFLLPENLFNLFKELESSKDVERNWKYLLKSRYREFLMTDKANYVDLLYYKSCFGEMKYNFPNKRFKTVSFKQDLLEVYLPLTQLIPTNFVSLLTYSKYRKLRYDMLSDICMVPLPNFTTCPNEETDEEPEETGEFEKFWAVLKIFAKFLRKIFIPINPFRQNEQFSPFLQVEKNNSPFFYIPAMEAIINSRWNQTKLIG